MRDGTGALARRRDKNAEREHSRHHGKRKLQQSIQKGSKIGEGEGVQEHSGEPQTKKAKRGRGRPKKSASLPLTTSAKEGLHRKDLNAEQKDGVVEPRPDWKQTAGRLKADVYHPEKGDEVSTALDLAVPPAVWEELCASLNVRIGQKAEERAHAEWINQAEAEQYDRISKVAAARQQKIVAGNRGTVHKSVPDTPVSSAAVGALEESTPLKRPKRQNSYKPFEHHEAKKRVYTHPVTVSELKEHFAIKLKAHGGVENVEDLFQENTYDKVDGRPHSIHAWATNLTTRRRFSVIHSAFNSLNEEHVLRYQRVLNDGVLQVWEPAGSLAVDESMNDWRGFSPHHVFVRGKPHPNGMKSWVVVDYSGVIIALVLFLRRDEKTLAKLKKVSMDATVIGIVDSLGDAIAKRMIVADRLFGSLSLAIKLIQRGQEVLFAVRKDRPNSIFGHWLVEYLRKNPGKKLAVAVLYVKARPSPAREIAEKAAAVSDALVATRGVAEHLAAAGGTPSVADLVAADTSNDLALLKTDDVVAVEGFELPLDVNHQDSEDVTEALVDEYKRARHEDKERDLADLEAMLPVDTVASKQRSRTTQTARLSPSPSAANSNLHVTRSRGRSLGVNHVQLGKGEQPAVLFDQDRRRHLQLRHRVDEGELVPLGALVELHDKKHVCKLFSVGSTATTKKKVEVLTKDPDSADDRQMIRETQEIETTGVANDYNDRMDPPDIIDKDYYDNRSPFRHMWWAATQVEYQLTMFITANARRYYMSGNGIKEKIPNALWRDYVFMAWTRPCKIERHPGQNRNCKVCSENSWKRSRTTFSCLRCGPVCAHCSGLCSGAKKTCQVRNCGAHLHRDYASHIHHKARANPLYLSNR